MARFGWRHVSSGDRHLLSDDHRAEYSFDRFFDAFVYITARTVQVYRVPFLWLVTNVEGSERLMNWFKILGTCFVS